jgi:hypothetical protein
MAEGLLNYFNQQINSSGGGGGSSPSFISARVYDIVLDETHPRFDEVGQWNGIGTIFYQTIDALTNSSSSENRAKPALANLKNYPLTK